MIDKRMPPLRLTSSRRQLGPIRAFRNRSIHFPSGPSGSCPESKPRTSRRWPVSAKALFLFYLKNYHLNRRKIVSRQGYREKPVFVAIMRNRPFIGLDGRGIGFSRGDRARGDREPSTGVGRASRQ